MASEKIQIIEADVSKALLMPDSLGGMNIIILYKDDTAKTIKATPYNLSDLSKTSLEIINVEEF